jgi:hypothetical protein
MGINPRLTILLLARVPDFKGLFHRTVLQQQFPRRIISSTNIHEYPGSTYHFIESCMFTILFLLPLSLTQEGGRYSGFFEVRPIRCYL